MSVATDFVTHLHKTKDGFSSSTTWVYRLAKRVHFIASKDSDRAVDIAKTFFANIVMSNGIPDDTVSDRDPKFTSRFWKTFMTLCRIKFKISSRRHPQRDRSFKIMNPMIENYLRFYRSHKQDNWSELLHAVEFCYNSSKYEDMVMPPFGMYLEWNPKTPPDCLSRAPDNMFQNSEDFTTQLEESIKDVQ